MNEPQTYLIFRGRRAHGKLEVIAINKEILDAGEKPEDYFVSGTVPPDQCGQVEVTGDTGQLEDWFSVLTV